MKVCQKCNFNFNSESWISPSCNHEPGQLNGIEAFAPDLAKIGGGFKSEYFSDLAKVESKNFWFKARNQLIIWALITYKSDSRNFLEVGCGTGFVLSAIAKSLPKIELTGSEIFSTGLTYAATRVPSARLMQMDARYIPFVEEFDSIGAFDVLEHIKDDAKVLSQLERALKIGGVLLLTVPQHRWLWSASDEYACRVRRYSSAEIEQKVLAAGFEIVRSSSFVTSLLPAMILSRIFQKRALKEFNPMAELKINPFLNIIFYLLMKLEIWGISIGISYPFGGSRLIVARKVTK